jgi:4-hydroxymandelate oxidase
MTLTEIYQKGHDVLVSKGLDLRLRGVETEYVRKHNEEIFSKYRFYQKAINSINVSTATKLLDIELQIPIVMSSITGLLNQIQPDGFIKVARALKATGSMMWIGSPGGPALQDLLAIGVPVGQTVKPLIERDKITELLLQAEAAGASWVGIEVDAGQGTKILDKQAARHCFPLSLDEIREIKKKLTKPLLLKGIISPWDAEMAMKAGANAIVVSNHGGHTIDYLPSPLEVLAEIRAVIDNQIPIIVDGGFRRGTDVLKGLALGAQAVGILRPIIYGLAADGEEGVKSVITEMTEELRRAMIMTGVKDPASAHKEILL